jgi:RNA polymerase sigma-70 factor (ECF subfamily)
MGVNPQRDVPEQGAGRNGVDYDQIYREHQQRVRRLCRLLLADSDEADDVAQEVFLKLLRAHRPNRRPVAWGAWLNRVTINACRDRRRTRWWRLWRGDFREFHEADFPHGERTPEEEALGEEKRSAIWRAFSRLPGRQREVFALRYLEGCSTEETAEALGVSSGSVKRHLFRAVRQLRLVLRGAS